MMIVERFCLPKEVGLQLIESKYFSNFATVFANILENYDKNRWEDNFLASQAICTSLKILTSHKDLCMKMIKRPEFLKTIFQICRKIEAKGMVEFLYSWENQKYFTDEMC